MPLYRAFATVGAMTIWSRILGFIRDVLIAAVLGAGPVADAFFVAFRVPNLFRRLFAEGAFDAAFIPLFAKRFHGEGGEDGARAFAEQALAGLTLALVAFTLLGELVMPWLMLLLAPGFANDPAKFDLAVLLARIALPFLLCMSLVALYSGVLNALGRFAVAAFVPSLLNVVLIAVLLTLIAVGDVDQSKAAVALAWGTAASGVLQVIVVAVAAAKSRMRLSFRLPRFDADMRRLLALAAPGVIAGGMNQITIVLNTIIASLQDRVVSWLYYANRLYELPLGVASIAIAAVLVPMIAAAVRHGEGKGIAATQSRGFEIALGLALPAAVAFALLAEPIARGLFERGAFGPRDTAAVAAALAAICAGLPGHTLEKILGAVSFAHEDTRTPMLAALAGLAAAVAGSLALFPSYGHVGVAAAIGTSGWVGATLLGVVLWQRRWLQLDRDAARRLPRIVAATLVMGLAVFGLHQLLASPLITNGSQLVRLAALALLVATGLAVYLASIELLGVARLRDLLAAVRHRT